MASKLDGLDPEARRQLAIALAELERSGIRATISSGYRSPEKQRQLWENRFTNPFPVAPPGRSKHEHGTAVDLVLANEKQRQQANQILGKFGWQWPLGDKDRVHYEFDPGKSPANLLSGRVQRFEDLPAPPRAAPAQRFEDLPPPPKAKVSRFEDLPSPKQYASFEEMPAPVKQPRTAAVAAALGGKPAQQTIPGTQVRLRPGDPNDPAVRLGGRFQPDIASGVRTTVTGVGPAITRMTTTLAFVPGAINAATGEVRKVRQQHMQRTGKLPPVQEEWKALHRGLMKAPDAGFKAAYRAAEKGEPTQFDFWHQLKQDPEYGEFYQKLGPIPEVMDFLTQMILDAKVAKVQGALLRPTQTLRAAAALAQRVPAVGAPVARGLTRAEQGIQTAKAGAVATAKKVPKVRDVLEGRAGYEETARIVNRAHAQVGHQVLPKLDDWHKDIQKTSKWVGKKTKLRTTDPATGQPVNELTRLAADYMDAGAKGSRHEAVSSAVVRGAPGRNAQAVRRNNELRAVQSEAQALGVPWKEVERIGKKGQDLTDQIGQMYVDWGLLSQESFDKLRGSYLPRSYLLTSGDFRQRSNFISRLEQQGAITRLEAEDLRISSGLGPDPNTFGGRVQPKGPEVRELETFQERIDPTKGRAIVPEATPAVTAYVERGVDMVADAQAHAQIVKPELGLALKRADVEAGVVEMPRGWKPYTLNGEEYVVNPGVRNYLMLRRDPGSVVKWMRRNGWLEAAHHYENTNRLVKRIWVSSPKTATNNIVGNYVLGESTAAIHGARYTPGGYAAAAKEWKRYRKTGKMSPELEEALSMTDILGEGGIAAPKGVRSFRGGFGVETAGQKALAAPGKAFDWWSDFAYADPEKAGRYYLYKELRRSGKSADEAAQIVNRAMITYTDIGPLRRAAERNALLGVPFITFPSKAIFRYAETAALRPDRFYTYTGERFRDFFDELADEELRKKGKIKPGEEGFSARKRRLGELSPFELALPGILDAEGKQRYIGGQMIAPMFGGLLSSRAGLGATDLAGNLGETVKERLLTAIPAVNLLRDVAFNKQTYNQMPIVTPGSIPGTTGAFSDIFRSPEVAGAYGGYVASSFIPQLRDIGRFRGALQGERAYPAPGAPPLELGPSVLKFFTGLRTEPGVGYNPLERKFEKGEDLLANIPNNEYTKFLSEYGQEAGRRLSGDVLTVLNPRFRQAAEGIRDARKIDEVMDGAKRSLATLIDHDKTTGDERKRKVREMFEWIVSLGQAKLLLVRDQAQSLTTEQQGMFEGTPIDTSP